MPLVVPGINNAKGSGNSGSTDSWMQKLMGKKLTETGSTDNLNFAKKDLPSKHRVVDSEGGMMTMDFQQDRLNVHVDKDGTVKKVTHG